MNGNHHSFKPRAPAHLFSYSCLHPSPSMLYPLNKSFHGNRHDLQYTCFQVLPNHPINPLRTKRKIMPNLVAAQPQRERLLRISQAFQDPNYSSIRKSAKSRLRRPTLFNPAGGVHCLTWRFLTTYACRFGYGVLAMRRPRNPLSTASA